LAHLVVAAMERKRYRVDRGPGEVNIVYVEGMNPDGSPNADEANKWNDLRLLIRFEGGEPRIIGEWAATTEPGRYWTENPMNPLGAARIEFGQYKAWQVGIHNESHEALVQTGGPLTVCRDLNKDGQRTGDTRQTGEFGINQHWGKRPGTSSTPILRRSPRCSSSLRKSRRPRRKNVSRLNSRC
jgi:hypothetical protein